MSDQQAISPGLSLHLNVLRLGAAMAVLIDHLLLKRYHGLPRDLNAGFDFGADAVMVFFAISGFVIAHAASGRTAGAFAFARLTRLWSVMVPAVILTFALDRLGSATNPAAYAGGFYNPLTFVEYLFFGLTFSNEWMWQITRIGINGPLWSLSYEAAYYALFAVAFYARGWARIAMLGLGAAIAGPMILAYMPAWLAGVAVYHAMKRPWALPRALLWAAALGPVLVYAGVAATGHPSAGPGLFPELGRQAHLLWDNAVGLLAAVHIFAVGLLCRGRPCPTARSVDFLAGASFSIYVCHFPLIQITSALTGWTGPAFIIAGGAIAFLGSLVFAQIFERPLPLFRRVLARMINAASGRPATP